MTSTDDEAVNNINKRKKQIILKNDQEKLASQGKVMKNCLTNNRAADPIYSWTNKINTIANQD